MSRDSDFTNVCEQKFFKPLNTVFCNKTVQCITTTEPVKHLKQYLNYNNASWISVRNVASLKVPLKRVPMIYDAGCDKEKCQKRFL